MPDPDIARDYQERDVRAVHEVLIELGQVLGSWREKFVIVGGAVPWLSFQKAIPPHIGTMDLDLDLDSTALCDGEYASLIEALQAKGYERGKAGMKPFQLRRWIKVDEGDPIGVLIDLLMPRQARGDHNKVKLIDGLRVQKTDGGEVALRHKEMRKFEGTMPDGRHNEVKLQIATIPALLSMKGYALFGRDKKKDAYDIYYSIRHFKGGLIIPTQFFIGLAKQVSIKKLPAVHCLPEQPEALFSLRNHLAPPRWFEHRTQWLTATCSAS